MLVYARFLSVYVILPTHVSPQVQWIIERKRPPPFYCSNGNNACHGRRLIVSYISAFDRDIFIPYSGVFRKNYETCMTHVIILYKKKKDSLLNVLVFFFFNDDCEWFGRNKCTQWECLGRQRDTEETELWTAVKKWRLFELWQSKLQPGND